jgi:heme A synthase
VTVLFSAAGLLGGWRWWRGEPSLWFWRLLRLAQVLLVVEAALGGVLVLMDRRPDDGLHYLYGLLPLAVSFVAEQLRLAAADTVLDARGLDSAQAVGELPSAEQHSVAAAILRRELGALAAGALVAAGLCIRAALT